ESSLPSVLEDQWRHDSHPNITTRSRGNVMESSVSSTMNKQWPQEESRITSTTNKQSPQEESRISSTTNKQSPQEESRPPMVLNHRRVVPYPTGSLGQMTEKAKSILCNARTTPLNNILKHSHTLLR
nr:hypothetical protein [Tanacetum cinerariifolium]